jgi:pimeloyl-ACP methyl ester carboxylesterase
MERCTVGKPTNTCARGSRSSPRRACCWWGARILGGVCGLLVVLALAGALYQTLASRHDRSKHPPPGSLVDVGSYRLHIYCLGAGSPTVVLEAAQGGDWLEWSLVQDGIAEFSQVCAYDRAGLGWSDPVRSPLRSSQVARSLHTLLGKAGIEGPYVMVGHSIGGIYVRAFGNQYPDEVAAIVLLDSSHEEQRRRFPQEFLELEDSETGLLSLCRYTAPLGLVRLVGAMEEYASEAPYGAEQREMYLASMNRTHYCRTLLNEQAPSIVDASQPSLPPSLSDIRLYVVTAGISWGEGVPPGDTRELLERAYQVWRELQLELAALSSNSTRIVAENSRHYIQHDQPGLVVDVIQQAVESVRP